MEKETTRIGSGNTALVKTAQGTGEATRSAKTVNKAIGDENKQQSAQKNGQKAMTVLILTQKTKRKVKRQGGKKEKEKRQGAKN